MDGNIGGVFELEWEVILRLLLAMAVGGIIGLEREKKNRPAGFRTHTLVCVGSALVYLTSEHTFNKYHHLVNLDPARLPAQVVSGIGFLGAGTIIHYGANVKGLTSAATLWVVACLGLAVGAGFYWGAISATIIVQIILILLKRVEVAASKGYGDSLISLRVMCTPEQVGKIAGLIGELDIELRDINISPGEEPWLHMECIVSIPDEDTREELIVRLEKMEGVVL